jgi:AraC-like DNA-binding protein
MKRGGQIDLDTSCNVMINWATTHLDNPNVGATTLAVRWALNGQRLFESRNRRFAVDDSSYRIFNYGSEFSSTIRSVSPVECYTVCFQPELAESALAGLVTPDEKLLDEPAILAKSQSVQFMEKTSPHDEIVSPIIQRLERYKDTEVATHGWFEEQFRVLLLALIQADSKVQGEIDRVPAARAATRDELYRRIQGARDFMEAGLSSPITIQEIASEAAFSPFHFLRIFKQVFGETPHQYLTRRRVEAAKSFLKNTEMSVTDICLAIGFESLGSFSWMFRRHVGLSPEGYRSSIRKAPVHHLAEFATRAAATANRVA